MLATTADDALSVWDRATNKLKEKRMMDAALKQMIATKLYNVFTRWLALTMHADDRSDADIYDDETSSPVWQQRWQGSPERRAASDVASTTSSISGIWHRPVTTGSPAQLDTSTDSEAFGSPQSLGALSPVGRKRGTASPRQRDSGSLSPVQLLRRRQSEVRSHVGTARTPSP